jgi:glutamate/tyrosine decarboxylase-like PLP-dependent enzyme
MAEQELRKYLIERALELVGLFEESFGAFPVHPSVLVEPDRIESAWAEFSRRMQANYPFFHPRFAGQMLKPPHPVAAAGYLAGLLINPNNHALDGGPVTSEMEKEVIAELAGMFRLPRHLGHLTSSGTIANLEALFVARELAPGKKILYGANAHYTHRRMCHLLGLEAIEVRCDRYGRIDLDDLERWCASQEVGTVVLTAGTTGLGAVDPVAAALELKDRYGVRLHVDAAYGGFYSILAWDEETAGSVPSEDLRAIAGCDSVVVDPHKHGLQPYGCGAVLFSDPSVGQLYRHDSPYTYFTSEELHLGEISLECSRAGAAAAGLWLTTKVLPLAAERGFGPILAACRQAAIDLASALSASSRYRLLVEPELDIVTYFPWRAGLSREELSRWSKGILFRAMERPDPYWLSTLAVEGPFLSERPLSQAAGEDDHVTVLRSVLMKPEHELWGEELVAALESLAAETA